MIKKMITNAQLIIGLLLILIVVAVAIFAPMVAPNDPYAVDSANKFMEPCSEYPLGTDELGRCEFSRLLYATRYSISISFPILLILSIIGLIVGTVSVCAGKKVDQVLTFIFDVFISFPSLVIAIAIIGVLGNGIQSLIIAVVISMWAWFARVVRSFSIVEMGKDYILAARIAGCNTGKLIFRHIIPNIMPQFLVYMSTGIASSIVTVSSFAFLGIGLPVGTPEWGAMIESARNSIFTHRELMLYPGLCIILVATGFNMFGEAIRDSISGEAGTYEKRSNS